MTVKTAFMQLDFEQATMGSLLQQVCAHYHSLPALRWKQNLQWQSIDWMELRSRTIRVGLAFLKYGLKPGERIAIVADNSPEWMITDFALASIGAVSVPIYPTLEPSTIKYILKDADVRGILVGDNNDLKAKIISIVGDKAAKKLESGKYLLLCLGEASDKVGKRFEDFCQLSEAVLSNRQLFYEHLARVTQEAVYTIIYTSGTTGRPKGVVLRHGNMVANLKDTHGHFPFLYGMERYLSYLPMSHAFERHCQYAFLFLGGELVYSQGYDTVAEELKEIEPTILVTVPRFLEKVHAKIYQKVSQASIFKRLLFYWAVRQGKKHLTNRPVFYALANRLVLSKLKAIFGSAIRFVISGGAALDPEIAKFFNGIGLPLAEGYGMTEAAPVIACNPVEDIRIGTVGKIYASVDAKIGDDDELLIRGPSITRGYYNNETQTKQTIDQDGWLHTGDCAVISDDRYLKITGRLKEILITSGGKNIGLQRVEQPFTRLPWVDQVCVLGDGKPFLVALLVVDPEAAKLELKNRLNKKQRRSLSANLDELPNVILDESFWQLVEDDMQKTNASLSSFETIKRVALLDKPFSQESGTLTPTQKIKRHEVLKQYKETIDALYGEQSCILYGRIPLLPKVFLQHG